MSGWARLWIFVSFLYLVGVLAVLWVVYPRTNLLYRERYEEIFNFASEFKEFRTNLKKPADFKAIHPNSSYKNLTLLLEKEIMSHPENFTACSKDTNNPFCDLIPKPDIQEIIRHWEKRTLLLKEEQKQLIYYAIILWIIPIMILYILGWLLSWVIEGFRGK